MTHVSLDASPIVRTYRCESEPDGRIEFCKYPDRFTAYIYECNADVPKLILPADRITVRDFNEHSDDIHLCTLTHFAKYALLVTLPEEIEVKINRPKHGAEPDTLEIFLS